LLEQGGRLGDGGERLGALLHRHLGSGRRLTQAQFALERVNDSLVRQVLERTQVVANAEFDKPYPDQFPARVTITLDSGESFTGTVPLPKGDPGTPLSDEALEDKFRGNCVGLLGSARTDRSQGAILGLPEAPTVEALLAGRAERRR